MSRFPGCRPTATEPDRTVVGGQVNLNEQVETILPRCDPITLDLDARAVCDDARQVAVETANHENSDSDTDATRTRNLRINRQIVIAL